MAANADASASSLIVATQSTRRPRSRAGRRNARPNVTPHHRATRHGADADALTIYLVQRRAGIDRPKG